MELLIHNQSVRLNIIGNQECLSFPKENQKLRENDENQEKPILIEDTGNLMLQMLEKFRNMKSYFLTEFKSFKNDFLQSCVKHAPGERVHANTTSETAKRFINHLEDQISFLKGHLINKDKIISSLIDQLSKKQNEKNQKKPAT